ncbi:hypothetical protein B0H17DRAFT_1153816 [Mycena rosella]|uniref:Uncharacterized protein n=1 Tax=Mycena rosella TaxID=1033263 RepID=A0AAD7B2W8_MYCRO|nr:hypothetical protein B0H17DRAFT_1153816 [Mycena rosella]
MFGFPSVFAWSKNAPDIVDISAEFSGYHANTDSLHSEPRRHRFSVFHARERAQGETYPVGRNIPASTRVKHEPEPLSHIPLKYTPPRSASYAGPSSNLRSALQDVLPDEIAGLLSQHLPGKNHKELVDSILDLAKQKIEHMQEMVPILLAEEPLGLTARQQLVDAVCARILNHQMSIESDNPSKSTLDPSSNRQESQKKTSEHEPNMLQVKTTSGTFGTTHPKSTFHYFSTTSDTNIQAPLATSDSPRSGDLFIHTNTQTKPETKQVWLYNTNRWEDISEHWKKEKMVVYPTIADRFLTVREDKSPNWILRSSAENKLKTRKAKERSQSTAL